MTSFATADAGTTDTTTTNNSPFLRLLFHGGDNMLGRAVQLSLPIQSPGEEAIKDSCTAAHYVDLSLQHPAYIREEDGHHDPGLKLQEIRNRNQHGGSYLWGDYMTLQLSPPPDVRVLNLETAVTRSIDNPDVPKWKGIRYHMHVDNFESVIRKGFASVTHQQAEGEAACAAPPSPVVICCGNNHAMDYGRKALVEETLPAFERIANNNNNSVQQIQAIGCGNDLRQAQQPAWISAQNMSVQVVSVAAGCSGTPKDWWATETRAGLVGLPALTNAESVQQALDLIRQAFAAHDNRPLQNYNDKLVRVLSIHWGPNWANKGESPTDIQARRLLAHRLMDECGVDIIYGHSSHHVRGMELYNGKLILYGAGDIINDYEGFENAGEERYERLGGIFIVDVNTATKELHDLTIIPTFMNRLQLRRWTPQSQIWRPNQRVMQRDPHKARAFCRFINELSRVDAGSDRAALLLKVMDDDDPEFPLPGSCGPILRAIIPKHSTR